MQLTCYSSGERPSTPVDEGAVFCVVLLEQVVSTEHSSYQQAVPCGTGFAISNKHVFTARHNCADADKEVPSMVGLVKEIIFGGSIQQSAVIMLHHVESNAADDWAVFERVEGEFASSVKICTEGRLPDKRAPIGIKDFPVGLIDTTSRTKLTASSVHVKVYQYEKRLPDAGAKRGRLVMKIGGPEYVPVEKVEDVIAVYGGRISGSNGAPYFNAAGEVVAFHEACIDGSDAGCSSDASYSHGWVLCRIPSFVTWYRGLTGTDISDVGADV